MLFVTLASTLLCAMPLASVPSAPQTQTAPAAVSPKDKRAITAFEKRVKEYVKLRERVERRMPKLSKDSTPEQISAHKTALQTAVRTARTNTKPGQIFLPDIVGFIRATIKEEFKGQERKELREEVLTADTEAVALRVNYPYPESEELVEMSPTLLLKLPQLPKQVKYRFVRRSLLLVDRENGLILDYMPDALP